MPRRTWDDPWNSYPESVPLPTTDGLATSKQRGAMAGTWWSKRFVDVLESFGLGTRMGRGRRYARSGQVVSLDVRAGLIVSQVQGSRSRPYVVTIAATTPTPTQWKKITDAFGARVGFAAQLLAGEVPPELEAVFTAARTHLLPTTWKELDADCNCPDWENPCKHIAAVLYLFADRLDTDPWLLLQWHGRTRDEILGPLRARAGAGAGAGAGGAGDEGRAGHIAPWWPFTPFESLPMDAVSTRDGDLDGVAVDQADPADPAEYVEPADPPDAVLRRCEPLAVTVRDREVVELLGPAYDALAARDD